MKLPGTDFAFSPLLAVLLGLAFTCIIIYSLYLAALPKPIPGIPYNQESAKRLFGDIPLLAEVRYRRQWAWAQPREHGAPVSQIFLFPFRTPTVVVSDYREVVDIISRRSKEFDRGTRTKECIGFVAPTFHFTMETSDPRFKFHKKLIRDLMTPKFLNNVSAPRIYDKALALVALWNLKASKACGRPFSATEDLFAATLDMICVAAFGMENAKSALRQETAHVQSTEPIFPTTEDGPVEFPRAPTIPELDALFDGPKMVSIAQGSPFPYFSQFLALMTPSHARAHWNRKTLIMGQIDKSLQRLIQSGADGCESALDQLLWREMNAAKEADRLPDYYSPAIRDEILGYLVAGHDTSAATLAWWAKYMTAHQSIQARLRDALRQAHFEAYRDSRLPTMKEICDTPVPYLDAVIEETLRHAAVASLIVRTSTCDTQILGYRIPKGTDILLPLVGPSITEPAVPVRESARSPESQEARDQIPYWGEDVSEFKPERWLKRAAKNAAGGDEGDEVFDQYAGPTLAFSAGPRQCFGRRLAYMKLRTVMTLLMWNFELQPLDEALNTPDIIEILVNLPEDCYVKLAKA
ncbi:cytochrome P450 [Trichoderma novae-zelandiae]